MVDLSNDVDETIRRLLRSLRTHLGLDVAFVAELDELQRVFRYVDSELPGGPVEVGGADPAETSYCRYVVDGRLPQLLADPAAHPVAAALPSTAELGVGTHLSVPVRFSDGSVYGTLCGFALEVREYLDQRDLGALHVMADVVGSYLEEREGQRRQRAQRRSRLDALTGELDLQMAFQPIVELDGGTVVGAEALARFPTLGQGPAKVFADAWQLGLGTELELKAIRAALTHLPLLPDGAYLSINASPATLTAEEFSGVLDGIDADQVVLEVTEHAAVADAAALLTAIRPLVERGVRLAIDDAGSGFSGLQQILRLSPDIIKLDAALVRDIDTCPAKQAMISGVVTFTSRMHTALVAEAIETAEELTAQRVLGVGHGQGYHTGRPHPLPTGGTRPAIPQVATDNGHPAPGHDASNNGRPPTPSKRI